MAIDYARHALSQRAAFEATYPAARSAARLFADAPVLRVVDLGTADGVNSHGLIRALMEERAGLPLVYAFVDLPTNAWGVAAEHLREAFGGDAGGPGVVVIPPARDARRGVVDVGTGPHYASPEAHGEACGRAVEDGTPPGDGGQHGGHPPSGGELPAIGHRARRSHRDGDALGRRRSRPGIHRVGLPGLPGPHGRGRAASVARGRRTALGAVARMRSIELAPGGRFIAAIPASPAPCPERTGLYVEIIGDMNRLLADWRRAGRIGDETVAAVVVPVWMRTLDEIRAPFEAGGGRVAGLELESAELFRLDNPYWDDDPAVFAREYVRSVNAWGGPLLLGAFAREGNDRAPGLLADFLGALEERVADGPDRYRWDYIEALVICRKTGRIS